MVKWCFQFSLTDVFIKPNFAGKISHKDVTDKRYKLLRVREIIVYATAIIL